MAQLKNLYPYFGSYRGYVTYYKSASEFSYHYLIVVSDPEAFKRTGIRMATFTYDKKDVRYKNAVIRYGNTSPKIRLPQRRFEESISNVIQQHEGVYESVDNEMSESKHWLHGIQTRLDGITKRFFEYSRKKKLGSP